MKTKTGTGAAGYGTILKYIGLFGGVQGLQMLLSIVRTKCAAVLIGTVGVGMLDLYNRALDLLSNTANLGLPFSAIRHLAAVSAKGDEAELVAEIGRVRRWTLLTALLGFLLTLGLAPLLGRFAFHAAGHAFDFVLLAPTTAMLIVFGGEVAILKGVRRLGALARVSAVGALVTLVVAVACYAMLGLRGVLPAICLSALGQLIVVLVATCRRYPYAACLRSRYLGRGLLGLGVAYTLAGIAGTGAELAVRSLVAQYGSVAQVGLYSAGFLLCVTYSRLIFIAMDADYFPRLSAVMGQTDVRNATINRQVDVCLLLMAPFLVLFMGLMPVLVPLLYSQQFVAAIPMAVCASFYLFFKAISAPVAYMPLARGDARVYLLLELTYDVLFVLLVWQGYRHAGLMGAGWALSLANLLDVLLILTLYGRLYGFKLARRTVGLIAVQGLFVAMALMAVLCLPSLPKYAALVVLMAASATVSYRSLGVRAGRVLQALRARRQKKS